MAPVSRKLPNPFFLLLRMGKPNLPRCFPARLSLTRSKNRSKARSRFRRASCGAHSLTSYIQGTSVFLSVFSSRCRSIADGLVPVARYASCLRANPQLYAQRAAPACLRQAVICLLLRSSSVLYARWMILARAHASLFVWLLCLLNTAFDARLNLCGPEAITRQRLVAFHRIYGQGSLRVSHSSMWGYVRRFIPLTHWHRRLRHPAAPAGAGQ